LFQCSIGAFLEGLDLIWRQAYIEALVWFDLMFDIRSSRIDLVFDSWSFERLSSFATVLWLPSVWCLPCVYPVSLSLTISISKLAYVSGFYWLRALAYCTGFRALAPCSSISLWLRALNRAGWALPWTPRGVVTLWWIGRLCRMVVYLG